MTDADLEPVERQPCPVCDSPTASHDVHGRCPTLGDPQEHVPGQMPLPLT